MQNQAFLKRTSNLHTYCLYNAISCFDTVITFDLRLIGILCMYIFLQMEEATDRSSLPIVDFLVFIFVI